MTSSRHPPTLGIGIVLSIQFMRIVERVQRMKPQSRVYGSRRRSSRTTSGGTFPTARSLGIGGFQRRRARTNRPLGRRIDFFNGLLTASGSSSARRDCAWSISKLTRARTGCASEPVSSSKARAATRCGVTGRVTSSSRSASRSRLAAISSSTSRRTSTTTGSVERGRHSRKELEGRLQALPVSLVAGPLVSTRGRPSRRVRARWSIAARDRCGRRSGARDRAP